MKNLLVFLTLIIVSLFFFPIEFISSQSLQGINTKMMLAILGILIFLWNGAKLKRMIVSKEIFYATVIATVFSLIALHSITYNNTDDYAYATYIISMWVWLGAAYAVCYIISRVHGSISVKLVVNYLIGVCVVQCALALLIDNISSIKLFVDSYTSGTVAEAEFMNQRGRLYGIGAALDVAGTRFASVLIMIAVLLCTDNDIKSNGKSIAMYVFFFVMIAVIGSMIARTTNAGIVLALIYIICVTWILQMRIKSANLKVLSILTGVIFILVLACIYLYNNVPEARALFRFGFENFFNWVETGRWESGSTNKLQTMWIFPESMKTWIIGDGYFADPSGKGFYMQTDVGYLRFIFYCGLPGLIMFSTLFIYLTTACRKRFPQYKPLFILLLILVFTVWLKVSTDIFLVYALFMCIPDLQRKTNNQIAGL